MYKSTRYYSSNNYHTHSKSSLKTHPSIPPTKSIQISSHSLSFHTHSPLLTPIPHLLIHQLTRQHLTETASFTFRFHEAQDITFTDGSLNVTADAAVLVLSFADQINTDLSNTTTRTSATEALGDTSVFDFVSFLQNNGLESCDYSKKYGLTGEEGMDWQLTIYDVCRGYTPSQMTTLV